MFPSDIWFKVQNLVLRKKIRGRALRRGENCVILRSLVLSQYQSVMDGLTDAHAALC